MTSDPILSDDEPYSMPSMPTQWGGDSAALGRIDHYDILRKLGGGGFGVVYLAKDTASGIEVAIKTLHPLLKCNAEEMDLLREKFALVSRLSHPNIATALVLHPCRDINIRDDAARAELKLSPGDSVMVMRYAPGVTLSKWRRQFPDGIVPFDLALKIGRQVAAALDYAHGERIVHRDVKPGNIMVETLEDGGIRARILDFGLAAEIRSSMSRVSTEQGDTSGTRPYMAPEQWLGRKQDGRTDQYALACVLYELLSGAPPFAGVFETGDPAVMKDAVVRDEPAAIAGFPSSVNAALRRALSKDPALRFPSCAKFVEILNREKRDKKGEANHTHKLRRRLLPWILAALGVLVVCALVSPWFASGDRKTLDDQDTEDTEENDNSYESDGIAWLTPWGTWEDPYEISGFDRKYLKLVGTGDLVEHLFPDGTEGYIEEGTLDAFRRSGFAPNAQGKWVKTSRTKKGTARTLTKKPVQNRGKNGGAKQIDLGGGVLLEMVNCPDVAPDYSKFWIGRYEVTQKQWLQVMGTNPGHLEDPERPVEYVSWNDCQEFVRKLNRIPAAKASGLAFRLPNEYEWTKACLAGAPESADYCIRDDGAQVSAATLSSVANYGNNETVEVGTLRPNAWGLYDMHGNVKEWTKSGSRSGSPLVCGGAFYDSAFYCSARLHFTEDAQRGSIGVRLAATGIEP